MSNYVVVRPFCCHDIEGFTLKTLSNILLDKFGERKPTVWLIFKEVMFV